LSRSGKISVALPPQHISQLRRMVDAGEYGSTAEVIREAVKTFLQRRALHAGSLGLARLKRSLRERQPEAFSDPVERVDLLFDAGDAKA
jgi:Arc/MetJ-type ribon-helix-helix transcriptional regulator